MRPIAIALAAALLLPHLPAAASEVPIAHELSLSTYFETSSAWGRPGEVMASDEPIPTCYPAAMRTTWFAVRSTIAGVLQVITYADEFDLLATVMYRGSSFADLAQLDCASNPQPYSLGVMAHLNAGETVFVQVVADGAFNVRGTMYPSFVTDMFASAEQLTLGYTSYGWTTEQGTVEPGEPLACGGTRTAWLKFAPEHTTAMTFMTLATPDNDVLALYRGSSLDTLQLVGCGAVNTYQMSGTLNLAHEMRLATTVERGVTYYVQIAARQGLGGPFVMSVDQRLPVANDSPESALQLSQNGNFVQTTVGAFTRPLAWMCPYQFGTVWYRITPTTTGTLDVTADSMPTTAHRNFAPALAIHRADTGELLTCAQDALAVTQSVSVQAGTSYLIAAMSVGFPGDYRLHWAIR